MAMAYGAGTSTLVLSPYVHECMQPGRVPNQRACQRRASGQMVLGDCDAAGETPACKGRQTTVAAPKPTAMRTNPGHTRASTPAP